MSVYDLNVYYVITSILFYFSSHFLCIVLHALPDF